MANVDRSARRPPTSSSSPTTSGNWPPRAPRDCRSRRSSGRRRRRTRAFPRYRIFPRWTSLRSLAPRRRNRRRAELFAQKGEIMTASPDIVVAPLTPAVGGLVSGLDLSRPLSERTEKSLRDALAERHVLFSRTRRSTPPRSAISPAASARCTSIPSIPMRTACRKSL